MKTKTNASPRNTNVRNSNTQERTPMKTKTKASRTHAAPALGTHAFYAARRAQIQGWVSAVDPARFSLFNVDVPTVVSVLRGVLPKLDAMRPRFAALPEFDLARFDRLGAYTDVLEYTHSEYGATVASPDVLPALHTKGAALLNKLSVAANALVDGELISGEGLDELRGSQGFLETGEHLGGLELRLRNAWPVIAGRTTLTEAKLDEARLLSYEIVQAVGLRAQRSEVLVQIREERARVFTLLDEAYTDARRAVQYLRFFEGDADEIAPSLRAKDGSPRRKDKSAETGKDASGKDASGKDASGTAKGADPKPAGAGVPAAKVPAVKEQLGSEFPPNQSAPFPPGFDPRA